MVNDENVKMCRGKATYPGIGSCVVRIARLRYVLQAFVDVIEIERLLRRSVAICDVE